MFRKQIDMLCVGDMTTDAFIRLKDAHLHATLNTRDQELCVPFGGKIPFEYVKIVNGVGNAANAAVSAARLGLRAALVSDVGADDNGRSCIKSLLDEKVITTFVREHKNRASNYHFVLWYGPDRTILVNHVEYDYSLPKSLTGKSSLFSGEPRWMYLSSIAPNSLDYLNQIADYLDSHPNVKLSFQPGTFQLSLGFDKLRRIYSRADAVILNKEEAQTLLRTDSNDLKALMRQISLHGPKLTLITDGPKGAYMFDGERNYFMPIYPDPRHPFERTGCGDAFASTFIAMLAKGRSPVEALMAAPVNSMSVAQFIGSREGLLTDDQLEWWLARAPEEYRVREIGDRK